MAPAQPEPQTEIFSDEGEFSLKSHLAVYRGHVRVRDPQMNLTCDLLTARLLEHGGQITNIVAQGNVAVDFVDENGQTNHATGDKLVYSYQIESGATNELAVLTGSPQLDRSRIIVTGDSMVWNRITGLIRVNNQRMILKPEAVGATNSPPTNGIDHTP